MVCRHCGTQIADKALICYRCGTATTEPRVAPPPTRAPRGPLPLVIAILLIIAGAVLVLPQVPEGNGRVIGWGLVAAATATAVWTLRPTPRRR
jgi:zinc-ribbon domain